MKKTRVFINGGEGTTGLRINERFATRSDIELIPIDPELRKDPAEIKKKINESDITFLCLPDAAAREAVSYVENPAVKIIDSSTAHRTEPGWAYGFPELSSAHRERIEKGNRIAVPGCHASGFVSLVYPLVQAGILSPDSLLSAVSVTGYSGAGKKTIAVYEDAEARKNGPCPDPLCSPRQYALAQQHKHMKEMKLIPGLTNEPIFLPLISDFYCGMVVSVPLHAKQLTKSCTLANLREVFASHYENQKFIRVAELEDALITGNFIPANTVAGYDGLEIFVYGNEDRMVVSSRFDNLGKGASGAAIQCMNLMTGALEDAGLNLNQH